MPLHFAQEVVDVGHAHAADHALIADPAIVFALQKTQQIDLVFIPRRIISVAALGRVGNVMAAIPGQKTFSQPRARGDQRAVAGLARIALAEGVDLF